MLCEESNRLLEELGSLAENLDAFARDSKIDSKEDPTAKPKGNLIRDPKSIFFDY
jgi:hypothetical protein